MSQRLPEEAAPESARTESPLNFRVASRSRAPFFAAGEALTVWVLWLTYGAFYFCRSNTSAAIPGMQGELKLSKDEIGTILAALKIAYGVGQFINGQLADRFSSRRLLALGLLASAALNVIFGLGTGFYFLLFVWAANGYFQSLGWPPCMRVAANWFPVERRGRNIGIVGTGYQLTGALTFVVSGLAAEYLGWRFAFYIPAGILVASCLHMLLFLRESPPGKGERPTAALPDGAGVPAPSTRWRSFLQTLLLTLSNPTLWFLALSLGLLNACRFGFTDWGIAHLEEVQGKGLTGNALKYAVLPLGGMAGALAAGWASDRFFASRRAPVICVLLVLLSLLAYSYNSVVLLGPRWTVLTLALVGFTIFGPQVLLVGTAPVDLARRGTPAAAVGFVNFMGYMGGSVGDKVTGFLAQHRSWEVSVNFWAGCALAAAFFAALLWNVTVSRETQK